jgi:FkbM family methyltransferase
MSFSDLALGKPATQSSICNWSLGNDLTSDASIPVSAETASAEYCHTGFEPQAWWQVDLGSDCLIEEVRLLNRVDEPQRLRRFTVMVALSSAPDEWLTLYRKNDDYIVDPARPLLIRPNTTIVGRYVRIQLLGEDYLHIRRCQVIGRQLEPGEYVAEKQQMLNAHHARLVLEDKRLIDLSAGRNGHVCEIGNNRIFVDTERYSPTLIQALSGGGYEWRELQILPQILREGDRVLEIGTAVGAVTMAAADMVGADAVMTFDANPDMVDDAKRNFAANGLEKICANVGVMRNRAVWDAAETETNFHVSRDFWASRLFPGPTTADIVRIIKVPFVRFEDTIERHGANVIVCDIEGGEGDLLIGADLTGIRAILMETHYWSIGRKRTDEMIRSLVTSGFDINLDLVGNHVMVLERPDR